MKDSIAARNLEWKLVVSRNMSLFHHYMSTKGHFSHMDKFGINKPKMQAFITENGLRTHVFANTKNLKLFNHQIYKILNNRGSIDRLYNTYKKLGEDLKKRADKLRDTITVENLKFFLELYEIFCAGLYISTAIGRVGYEELNKLLENEDVKDKQEIINKITYPDEHTPLFQYEKEIIKIGSRIQKNNLDAKQEKQLLKEWHERWKIIPVNFNENPLSWHDAEKKLRAVLQKDCQKEMSMLQKNHEYKIKEKDRLLSRLSNNVQTVAYAVQIGTIINEYRKNVFCYVSYILQHIFRQVCNKHNIKSWRKCYFLNPDEFTQLLNGKTININEIAEKRSKIGIIIDENGKMHPMVPSELKEFYSLVNNKKERREKEHSARTIELKGISTNKGRVQGRVSIISGGNEFHKFKDGDILVTSMTSVDFVPLMFRAKAFVTDEGGITSHAAIVSREMDKPCVIGTKIATKIFKDGDLVEVNADKGIVRKI